VYHALTPYSSPALLSVILLSCLWCFAGSLATETRLSDASLGRPTGSLARVSAVSHLVASRFGLLDPFCIAGVCLFGVPVIIPVLLYSPLLCSPLLCSLLTSSASAALPAFRAPACNDGCMHTMHNMHTCMHATCHWSRHPRMATTGQPRMATHANPSSNAPCPLVPCPLLFLALVMPFLSRAFFTGQKISPEPWRVLAGR
jgi:hypothetical protein